MHRFSLSRTGTTAMAIAAHAQDPSLAFIAGGTDLLGLMKDRAELPERLLDINGLPDMARIQALPDGGLRVGALYPKFRAYFTKHRPPFLAVWGNDPFFLPPGAKAFERDNPNAEVHFSIPAHFALETHAVEIAATIHQFLGREVAQS